MPSSRQALVIRIAISPRFAISIFLKGKAACLLICLITKPPKVEYCRVFSAAKHHVYFLTFQGTQ